MSRQTIAFQCPNCKSDFSLDLVVLKLPKEIATHCQSCYFPLLYNVDKENAEIRMEKISKKAFLIHSSKREDKNLLNWFRSLLKLYGILTVIIEEDTRVKVDWLQKSLDAIRTTNFVIPFLTKRLSIRSL